MKYKKNALRYIAVLLVAIFVTFAALTSCSGGGANDLPTESNTKNEDATIVKTELINGELIVTYSDGSVKNLGPLSGESDSDSLSFYPLPDGTYGITAGNTIYLEGIAIPSTYRGRAVTRILNDAFKGLENLKSVTIPEGIVSIGASAFMGCSNLTSVTIPESVELIDSSAFYGCGSISEITIPEKPEKTTIGVSLHIY